MKGERVRLVAQGPDTGTFRPQEPRRQPLGSFRFLVILAFSVQLARPGLLSAQESPRWSLTETLRIGSLDDSATALTGVSQVSVSPSGLLYVGQPQEALIRVFDRDGIPIRTIGSRGDGPGEFRSVAGFGWVEGRFYVIDAGRRRISFFGPDEGFLGGISWNAPLVGGTFVVRTPTVLLPDSMAIAFPVWQAKTLTSEMTRSYPVLQTTWDGEVTDTITITSMERTQLTIDHGRTMTHTGQPFSDAPLRAFGLDGSVYVLDRSAPVSGVRSSYRVTKVSPTGDTVFASETDFTPRPLPPAHRDSVLFSTAERLAGGRSDRSIRETEARLGDLMFLPEFFPPASGLTIGADGKIWVRRERTNSAAMVRWDLLSPNGIRIAYLLLDPTMLIKDSVDGLVWSTIRDEFDVTYVVRSEIIRQ